MPATNEADHGVLYRILGHTRLVMSGELFLVADDYFHRGQHAPKHTKMDDVFLKRASDAMRPTVHMHLAGDTIKEMMPWLWFSLAADPNNVDAHLAVGFWLSRALGQNATAHEVLRIAQINNPRATSIYAERGRIYLREGRWAAARSMFDQGLAVLESTHQDAAEDALFDKGELLFYRSLIDEQNGDLTTARSGYEEVLRLFPSRDGIQSRLDHLGEGVGLLSPGRVLVKTLENEDKGREAHCSHPEAHEDADHDHDHD